MPPALTSRPGRAPTALLSLLLLGCVGADSPATARDTAPVAAPAPARRATADSAAAIDSALAAALGRFREGLPRTDTLWNALHSKDAVVRHFMALLARRDTAGLARLHLSRAEWAWIVYPESRYTRAPYRQRVDIGWMLITERSSGALSRVLARRGGRPLSLVAWRCEDTPEPEGRTLYWGRCAVTYRGAQGDTVTERLFSSIVERDGRYKIGSYSNQF